MTVRAARSIVPAGSPRCSSMPCSATNPASVSEFVRGAAREVRGEPDPVVSRTGLLTEHDHPVRRGQPALGQRLQEALADHAVTDEHDRGGVRGHREPPSSGCGAAACGQDPAVPAPVTTGRAFEVMPAACDAGVTRSHRRGFPGGTLISAGAGTGCEGPVLRPPRRRRRVSSPGIAHRGCRRRTPGDAAVRQAPPAVPLPDRRHRRAVLPHTRHRRVSGGPAAVRRWEPNLTGRPL